MVRTRTRVRIDGELEYLSVCHFKDKKVCERTYPWSVCSGDCIAFIWDGPQQRSQPLKNSDILSMAGSCNIKLCYIDLGYSNNDINLNYSAENVPIGW